VQLDEHEQPIEPLAVLERVAARYVPLLMTAPGIAWVRAFTVAAGIGDITRFSSPRKLCGYTGLCPRVNQSGDKDRRGPLTKQGPALPALGHARSDHARAAASRLQR
jgi:transposase